MALLMYVCESKSCFIWGRLTSQERWGGGGWERLVYGVWLFVWEFIRADNKALTKEESRCQAHASVMYAVVTKSSSK